MLLCCLWLCGWFMQLLDISTVQVSTAEVEEAVTAVLQTHAAQIQALGYGQFWSVVLRTVPCLSCAVVKPEMHSLTLRASLDLTHYHIARFAH